MITEKEKQDFFIGIAIWRILGSTCTLPVSPSILLGSATG